MGSARRSNGRKKLRKRGKKFKFHKSDKNMKKKKKRENIEALYERLKREYKQGEETIEYEKRDKKHPFS